MTTRYCLDTSFFIEGWKRHYHWEVFSSLWRQIEVKLTEGVLFSCNEVFEELRVQEDELFSWCRERKSSFEMPTEDVISEIQKIMTILPNFAATGGGSTNAADPWVIAHAKASGAIVVTYEEPAKTRKTIPPKIPNACDQLGVQWMTPIDCFRELGIWL